MDDIPNELLIHIVDQLRGPTTWAEPTDYSRRHALAALCCVSKKLNHIATPLLYESIDLPSNDIIFALSQRLWICFREQQRLRLDVKALRLKTRPVLADRSEGGPSALYVREEYKRDIKECLRRCGLKTEDRHIVLGRYIDREDLFFALVAFQTPNVEHLWMRPPPYTVGIHEGCTVLEGIGRMAMGVPWLNTHRFERLKTLYIDLVSTPRMGTRFALPLLLLPRLEELTLGSWGRRSAARTVLEEMSHDPDDYDEEVFDCPWVWPVRSSSITKLSLLSPSVSEPMAKKMILACKALKRFECIYPICHKRTDKWFGSLVPALSDHSESFEELSCLGNMHGDSLDNTGMAQLDPLYGLTRLNSVRVSLYLVSDPSQDPIAQPLPAFFPPSIKSLHIHLPVEADDRSEQHLLDILIGYKEGRLPSLHDVYITWVYFQFEVEGEQCDVLERLRSLLKIKAQYEMSSIRFNIFFTIRDDKRTSINWPKIVSLEGLVMDGTHMSDVHPIDHSNETNVFVNFTTCPDRYTAEELQDERDHGYFW